MRRVRLLEVWLIVGIALVGESSTLAQRARHERIRVTPRVQTVNGRRIVYGATIKLTLRTNGDTAYDRVRVGLGSMDEMKAGEGNSERRFAATEKSMGYLLDQLPEIRLGRRDLVEVEWKLTYGDNNSLAGGEAVDVLTAWGKEGTNPSHRHVWGMFYGPSTTGDRSSVIRLPANSDSE